MDPNLFIKEYAGTLSAEEMGKRLGLTENAVYKRGQKMKVSLQRFGENHPQAKVSDEVVRAAQVLYDHGGIPVSKIKKLLVGLGDTHKDTIWGWVDGRFR